MVPTTNQKWLGAIALAAAAPAAAQTAFADHDALDRHVAAFTGAAMGMPGGARAPVDRRLRLRSCSNTPAASWHGEPGRTVQLVCPDPGGWRIFVNLVQVPGPAKAVQAVKRGDALTVVVTGRGFAVRRSAEALEAGSVGDWIAVRTAAEGDPLRARIVQPGQAEIPLQ